MFDTSFDKHRPDWLKNTDGYQLELDGYDQDLKIAFEYQGKQHFEISHWDTQESFLRRQANDKIKYLLTKQRGIFVLYPTFELTTKDQMMEFIKTNLPPEHLFNASL